MTFLGSPRVWNPDVPPATPHSLDDEFAEDGALDGSWTLMDVGGRVASATKADHQLRVVRNSFNFEMTGPHKALPGVSNYTIWTKVRQHRSQVYTDASTYQSAGLFVSQATAGSGPLYTFSFSPTDRALVIASWASSTTFSAALFASGTNFLLVGARTLYLRLRVSSGTYFFEVSEDGDGWTLMGTGGLLGSSARVGLLSDNRTGVALPFSYEFFRVTESSDRSQRLGGYL